jgi:hypothetical protein
MCTTCRVGRWAKSTSVSADYGPMASVELSSRVEKVVGYLPLCDMDDFQRREFHEALLDADAFEDLPGKWQAAILKAEENRPQSARGRRRLGFFGLLGTIPSRPFRARCCRAIRYLPSCVARQIPPIRVRRQSWCRERRWPPPSSVARASLHSPVGESRGR